MSTNKTHVIESKKNCVNNIELIFSENKKENKIRIGYPGVLLKSGTPFSPTTP
jgi:hypothetical protein